MIPTAKKKPRGALYTIHPTKESKAWRVSKMSADLDVLESYHISEVGHTLVCACPAGGRSTCRHREMLRLFQGLDRIGSGMFYQYDSKLWYNTMGEVTTNG